MGFRSLRCLAAVLAGLFASAVHAQGGGWRPFVSLTPLYQAKTDLAGGGDFSAGGAIVRAGVSGSPGRDVRAGLTLHYDYIDYSFSGQTGFVAAAPWGSMQRYGLSVPLLFGVGDGWSLGLVPSIDWLRETGASSGDALAWGGIVSASKRFANGNRIGFGLGAFDRIEDTSLFPMVLVDWQLSERWRLVNPLPAGPTGPAGLELDYRFDGGWNLGLGAAWRSVRFRLSDSGPVPNGVGEERGAPVFLRATRGFGKDLSLALYAGLVTGGQLRVEDSSGNDLRKDDFDPAPLFGATFTARF